MVERKDVAGWLDGPGRTGSRPGEPGGYAGERLGLPETGPGSVAGFGRRIVAYLIDSLACSLIAYGLVRDRALTLPVFAVEVAALTWLASGSAGQLIYGLRIVRLDGKPVGLLRAVLRTVLLCLLVPALIWDRDGRGLHDKAAGTVVVRAR
ncbi:MAG TPA: RDD family protein [Actinomycetes bacterium]|nr:RDD family protein [Actinomycetes bacterium]